MGSVGVISVVEFAVGAMVVGNEIGSVTNVFSLGLSTWPLTFTMTAAIIFPTEALTTVVPGDTPIILPVPSTCAMLELLVVQTRVGFSVVSIGE